MILLVIVVAALTLLSLCALAGLLRSGQLREACLPPKDGELDAAVARHPSTVGRRLREQRVDDELAAMLDQGAP